MVTPNPIENPPPASASAPQAALFEARLFTDLAGVSSTLTLLPHKGNKILVNGETVVVPDLGMTRLVTDNLIDGNGDEINIISPAPNTLYYVYVSNSMATFSPLSIRLSANPYTVVAGVRYLGAAGNPLNWRFVGWVFLNSTPQFEFSDSNAYIANYYNRFRLSIFANPGYVDDDAITSYAENSATYVEMNGGVNARVNFISNGEDESHFELNVQASVSNVAANGFFGIGVDTVTGPERASILGGFLPSLAINGTAYSVQDGVLPEGVHFMAMLAMTTGGITATVFADFQRAGAVADPRATMISGFFNA